MSNTNPQPLPAVTIITANHNYGKWIAGCMLSAARESYPNKLQIVVDDGSTDNSWEIICKVAGIKGDEFDKLYQGKVATMPVLAYRFKEAGGPSRARNKAIELTAGFTDLFAPLDADDEYKEGKITESVKIWLSDPYVIGAIYTDYDIISETGEVNREYKPPFNREVLITMRDNPVHSAAIFSKLAINQVGVYDPELRCVEDMCLWGRISDRFVILHIPQSLMRVRAGSHSSSATVKSEVWQQCWRRVAEKTHKRLSGAQE